MRWGLNICGAIVGLYLILWILGIIALKFKIIWYKIKGHYIEKREFASYNPIYIFKYFTRNSDDKKINKVMLIIFIIGLISMYLDQLKHLILHHYNRYLNREKRISKNYYINLNSEEVTIKTKVNTIIECRQDILEAEEHNGDSFYYNGSQYYIQEALLPNGDIIAFSDNSEPLVLNEEVLIVDDGDKF